MGGRGLELLAATRPDLDGSGETLTFALPELAKKGDLMVVVVVRDDAVDAPEGWTQVETALGASPFVLDAWARLVDDDEPASPAWTTATPQELQGQLLLFGVGSPVLAREASATAAFTATTTPATPAAAAEQAIDLLLTVFSTDAAVVFVQQADAILIDTYRTGTISTHTILITYRRAAATGSISPAAAGASPAATGRAFSLVLREGPPITPAELFDPVPGNIGLLPS